MENSPVKFPENLQAATAALTENLLAAEPFVLYRRAQQHLNTDPKATALLRQLSASQASIRTGQARGTVTQKDIDQLRALQHDVQQNQVIMEYARSQQEAINFLREINQEISQLLGIDFATLARRSSCC